MVRLGLFLFDASFFSGELKSVRVVPSFDDSVGGFGKLPPQSPKSSHFVSQACRPS